MKLTRDCFKGSFAVVNVIMEFEILNCDGVINLN